MTRPLIEAARSRARLYRRIREFFLQRGHLEVDTPVLGRATGTDRHIQSLEVAVNGARHFLQTSPELYMKRLLAAASGSIYQICHAFRGEEEGRYHHAEFSMLEWYSVGLDYRQLMDEVECLINALVEGGVSIARLSYNECFRQGLGVDPQLADVADLRELVQRELGDVDVGALGFDDCLDLLMSQAIATRFRGFVFIYDYPATQAALARIRPGDPSVAERFELFHDGVELANGFSELIDADEQRRRFLNDNDLRRRAGLPEYPLDEAFLDALAGGGMPECAGVALGLDRLLMVLEGYEHIDAVTMR